MRPFALTPALAVFLGCAAQSQTAAPTHLGLTPDQIPADCKTVDGIFPVDMQTAILWDKPELYKSLIPSPVAKRAQSFACDKKDKGTVFFFQYANQTDSTKAATFIKPLLWGEPGPTAIHPELVLEAGDLLTVVSFEKTPKALVAALQRAPAPGAPDQNANAGASASFPIPGHGSLRFTLPGGWQSQSRPLADPPSTTLHFAPVNGDAFDVQITAAWLDASRLTGETPESIKADVQRAAQELLPHSVEKTATLHELHGPQTVGFYYALTDNHPGPGEFANLTQGIFLTGDILSAFTILHRTAVSADVDKALRSFAEAAYIK